MGSSLFARNTEGAFAQSLGDVSAGPWSLEGVSTRFFEDVSARFFEGALVVSDGWYESLDSLDEVGSAPLSGYGSLQV